MVKQIDDGPLDLSEVPELYRAFVSKYPATQLYTTDGSLRYSIEHYNFTKDSDTGTVDLVATGDYNLLFQPFLISDVDPSSLTPTDPPEPGEYIGVIFERSNSLVLRASLKTEVADEYIKNGKKLFERYCKKLMAGDLKKVHHGSADFINFCKRLKTGRFANKSVEITPDGNTAKVHLHTATKNTTGFNTSTVLYASSKEGYVMLSHVYEEKQLTVALTGWGGDITDFWMIYNILVIGIRCIERGYCKIREY